MTITAEQAIDHLQSRLGGVRSYKDTNSKDCAPHAELLWTAGSLVLRAQYMVGGRQYKFRVAKATPKLSAKKRVPQPDYVGRPLFVDVDKIDEFISTGYGQLIRSISEVNQP